MDSGQILMLVALTALLIGLAIGKAWERYKLQDGRWIDRRKARQSPHYLLGLNFLISNQVDAATDELAQAAANDPDALEIHMILGDLYREKGQVGRAIQVHQQLLQHPRLTKLEHVYALLSLGLDYRHSGFVDRAVGAFNEVLRLDPKNVYALLNLEKLHEEQHQWSEAYAIRQQLTKLSPDNQPRDRAILAFLENEIGLDALKRMQYADAARHFEAAIDLDARAVPAYLNLGDVKFYEGRTGEAAATWEKVIQMAPERAYLTFERLEPVYPRTGRPDRFPELCRELIAATPQDWRARLALARHLTTQHQPGPALELLFEALVHNPHALAVHQAVWAGLSQLDLPRDLVSRYIDVTRDAIFYLDPHVCLRCRYRSTELLWQCPQCHEWNSFVEERIAPAKDPEN